MKQKIIDAFKTKYLSFGLSNEAIDRIASALEKTVTKEEEIAEALEKVDTMNLIASELQKMRDKEIQTRTDLQNSFNAYKEKHPETTPPPTPPKKDEQEPEWAKTLREQNEILLKRQQDEDAAKAQKELIARLEAGLKKAGCVNAGILSGVLKGVALQKDETEDAAIERLKGDYNASVKAIFGDGPIPPAAGGSAFGDAKTALDKKNAFLRQQGLLPEPEKAK
ncbi:MAG: hypothetical protein IJ308_06905 [Clostridia bacterium]|nr:hypothetical protein [Clostridia bacterium]